MNDERFDEFKNLESNAIRVVVQRTRYEKGKTLSKEAMDELSNTMTTFVGARMMRWWDKTDVPPTRVAVDMQVSIQ